MKGTRYFLKLYHPLQEGFLVLDKKGKAIGIQEQMKPNGILIDPANQKTLIENSDFNEILCKFLHKNLPKNIDSPAILKAFIGSATKDLEKKTVLDTGSGNGIFFRVLKSKDNKVVGLDLIEGKGSKLYDSFMKANVEKIPSNSNVFDLTLAIFLLEHVTNVEKALLELIRVTKKGGNILILVPSLGLIETIKTKIGLDRATLNPEHFRYFGLLNNIPWCYNTKKLLKTAEKYCRVKKVKGMKITKRKVEKSLFKFFGVQTFIHLEKR